MSNNYETYGYENNNYQKRSSLLKRLLIILLIFISIILVLFLIKRCSNKSLVNNKPVISNNIDYERLLIEAGKKYFEDNYDKYPKDIGACEEIELQGLMDRNYVNSNDFMKCNTVKTYLKVCMLEDKSYQYSPWLLCSDKNSENEYSSERIGSLSDIKADQTMVNFKFIPQKLVLGEIVYDKEEDIWKDEISYNSYKTISSTTYYRYKDELFIFETKDRKYYTSKGEKSSAGEVSEYYLSAPKSNYNLKDSATTGYKWFTTSSKKEYATEVNGKKKESNTEIDGYPYAEVVGCKSYQTRTVTGSTNPNHYYKCGISKNSTTYVYQYDKPCGTSNPKLTYEMDNFYTCGNLNDVDIESKRVSSNVQCPTYGDWKYISGTCDTKNDTCRKVDNYCTYNWYRIEKDAAKKYYPSNADNSEDEKVYYTSAPIKGASKDENTKATVYKWYRQTTLKKSEYLPVAPKDYINAVKSKNSKWTDWSEYSTVNPLVNDGRNRKIESRIKLKIQKIRGSTIDSYVDLSDRYLDEKELIDLLREKDYSVNSLSDITNNGELKLKIQMLIRNKKESN